MASFQRALGPRNPTPVVLILASAIVGGFFSTSAHGATYLVKPDGSGLLPTIQAAIDMASDGDVIELADGIFTGVGNQDLDFCGKTITVRSRSGDPEFCILAPENHGSIPHRAFFFFSGETCDSAVESLTLRGGNASGSAGLLGSGGAVLCTEGSSPTFRDCWFQQNVAVNDGGAVSARESSPTFIRCEFEGNGSPFGGALFADSPCLIPTGASETAVILEDCRFLSNEATEGGAIFARGIQTSLTLRGCEFVSNFADQGGAAKFHGATATIDVCSIADNWGGVEGGGFAFESSIFCDSSTPPHGGGAPFDVTFTECLIEGNFSGSGGAALLRGYSVAFIGCTVVGNIAPQASGFFVRAHFDTEPFRPSFLQLENTILAFGLQGASVFRDSASTIHATCVDIFGNEGGDWVGEIAEQLGQNGNLHVDPLFCDLINDDYGLRGDSPCQAYPGGCGLIGAFPASCGVSWIPDPLAGGATGSPIDLRIEGNPFVSAIAASVRLTQAGSVELELLDVGGRRLAAQGLGWLDAGEHPIAWAPDSRTVPGRSGVHFLRASSGTESITRKLIRLR